EDGIRDKLVTGVQKCALPISTAAEVGLSEETEEDVPLFVVPRGIILLIGLVGFCGIYAEVAAQDWSSVYMHRTLHGDEAQAAFKIGRASCRGRGEVTVGDGLG